MNRWFLQRRNLLEMNEVSGETFLRIMSPPIVQGPISKKVQDLAEYETNYVVFTPGASEISLVVDNPKDLATLMNSAISCIG